MSYKQLVFIVLFVFSQFSFTQTILDWQDCINLIEKNNLQLKANETQVALNEIEIQKNKLNYSPNINAQSNYSFRIGKNYNFFENSYVSQNVHYQDYNLNIQQPIFDGLQTKNQIQKSKFDLEALKLENEALKTSIQMQVMTTYLSILNAKEQLLQAQNQQASTIEQKNKTQALIDAGMLPESNLFDIDVQLATEDANIIMAKNQVELTLLNLKNLLQIDLNEAIDVKTPEFIETLNFDSISIPVAQSVFAVAVQNRPEVLAQKFKLESARKSIKIAKSSNYPTLNFIGNINTFYTNQNTSVQQMLTGNFVPIGFVEGTSNRVLMPETSTLQNKIPYFKQLSNLLNYSFGLGLTIPIYNKNIGRISVKQAEQNIKLNEINQQQAVLDLSNTIQQAYLKTITAKENYIAAQKLYNATNLSYQTTSEKVQAGLSSQLELNLAKNTVSNSLSKLIQAKYDYIFNVKVLDYYQGKKIELD